MKTYCVDVLNYFVLYFIKREICAHVLKGEICAHVLKGKISSCMTVTWNSLLSL